MKLGKLNNKQVTIIAASVIGVIAIAVLVACWFECKNIGPYQELPKSLHFIGRKNPKSVHKKILTLEGEIKKYDELIDQREDLEREIRLYKDEWEELNKLLPKTTGFLDLQEKIYAAAKDNDLRIGGFTRDEAIMHDANTNRVHIQLKNISGGFHNLGNFLYYLYVPLKRFIVLQDFTITSGAGNFLEPTERSDQIRHKIELELVTFVDRSEN